MKLTLSQEPYSIKELALTALLETLSEGIPPSSHDFKNLSSLEYFSEIALSSTPKNLPNPSFGSQAVQPLSLAFILPSGASFLPIAFTVSLIAPSTIPSPSLPLSSHSNYVFPLLTLPSALPLSRGSEDSLKTYRKITISTKELAKLESSLPLAEASTKYGRRTVELVGKRNIISRTPLHRERPSDGELKQDSTKNSIRTFECLHSNKFSLLESGLGPHKDPNLVGAAGAPKCSNCSHCSKYSNCSNISNPNPNSLLETVKTKQTPMERHLTMLMVGHQHHMVWRGKSPNTYRKTDLSWGQNTDKLFLSTVPLNIHISNIKGKIYPLQPDQFLSRVRIYLQVIEN